MEDAKKGFVWKSEQDCHSRGYWCSQWRVGRVVALLRKVREGRRRSVFAMAGQRPHPVSVRLSA